MRGRGGFACCSCALRRCLDFSEAVRTLGGSWSPEALDCGESGGPLRSCKTDTCNVRSWEAAEGDVVESVQDPLKAALVGTGVLAVG